MGSAKLKEDLFNCLINFDRPVLMTALLDDYKLDYKEVNKIVENYLVDQEKKDAIKFEKRYLIHGLLEGELKNEIYKIIGETNLKEWLNKLKNAEFSLYSVELAGGAKAAAPVFKPMSIEECVKSKGRQGCKISSPNHAAVSSNSSEGEKEVKQEKSASNVKKESPKPKEPSVKKTPSKTETSSSDKKAADKKSAVKKGINNFFVPSTVATKKSEDTKVAKTAGEVTKPNTPNKMQDFFKKQAEKPKPVEEKLKTPTANTSVQLFDEEEPEEEEASSDEEEKLAALKRDIISSDVEIEDEDVSEQATSVKRRRILDSDDEEEDPPVKQEKLDIKEELKEEEAVAETYLDEDGFVITKKPKHKGASTTNKQPAAKKMPAVTIKSSPKKTVKSSTNLNNDTKVPTNHNAKTKQAGIMNFFSKK